MGEKVAQVQALALVGMPGAGKSLCAKIMGELGYPSFRFGSIVIAELKQRGLAVTPENERSIREELRGDRRHDGHREAGLTHPAGHHARAGLCGDGWPIWPG